MHQELDKQKLIPTQKAAVLPNTLGTGRGLIRDEGGNRKWVRRLLE